MSRPLPRTQHRSRGASAVLLVVTLAGALAGCGGDDRTPSAPAATTPTGTTDVTPTETPTPTPTQASDPTLPPAPTARDTKPAATAFTRFVVARWDYALATNDGTAVSRLSPKGQRCEGCRDLEAELARRVKQQWRVDYPGSTVRNVDVRRENDVWVGTARIDVPSSRSYYDDGSFRNESPAHSGARFTARFRLDKGGFDLLFFQVR